MNRRSFLLGVAACALTSPAAALPPPSLPIEILAPAPIEIDHFRVFTELLLRRVCETYSIPFEMLIERNAWPSCPADFGMDE